MIHCTAACTRRTHSTVAHVYGPSPTNFCLHDNDMSTDKYTKLALKGTVQDTENVHPPVFDGTYRIYCATLDSCGQHGDSRQ